MDNVQINHAYMQPCARLSIKHPVPFINVWFQSEAITDYYTQEKIKENEARARFIDEINAIKNRADFVWMAERSAFIVFLPELTYAASRTSGAGFYQTPCVDPMVHMTTNYEKKIFRKGGLGYVVNNEEIARAISIVGDLLVEISPAIDDISLCVSDVGADHHKLVKLEDAYEVVVFGVV